jgi:broad specificity phosphatase PhoE
VPDEPATPTRAFLFGVAAGPVADGRPRHDPAGAGGRVMVAYLSRHGRTALNADGVLRGRLDPPLDAVGRSEPAALGARFRDVGLAVVVISPLRRARQTDAVIMQLTGAGLTVRDALADRGYGPWAGTRASEVVGRFGSLDVASGVEPSPAWSPGS